MLQYMLPLKDLTTRVKIYELLNAVRIRYSKGIEINRNITCYFVSVLHCGLQPSHFSPKVFLL